MKKKQQLIFAFICLVLIPILSFFFYSLYSDSQYKQAIPPKIKADSIKALVTDIIQAEEFFVGDISIKYIDLAHSSDLNKAEIIMRNNATGDDSIGATEYKMLAEKKGQTWTIVEYKTHWKCARDLLFNFWTTNPCI